jgi:hypothetical protein
MLQEVDLLIRSLIRWVDLVGAEKLTERTAQIAALTKDPALIDMAHCRLIPHPFQVRLVAHLFGILQSGLAIVFVRRVKVLAYLRILAALVPLFSGLRLRRRRAETCKSNRKKEKEIRLKRGYRKFGD